MAQENVDYVDEDFQQSNLDHKDNIKNPKPTIFSVAKKITDTLLSLFLIGFFGPLLIILVVLIRLDGSPAFYSQVRLGQNGRRFKLWKLRTMVPDAERKLMAHIAVDVEAANEWRANQKLRRDPRVTSIGRILRKYSLDELPQIFNVLSGDMSLIGPRPMMVDQESLYPGIVYAGLRPGLTGLWQVSKRDDATFAARAQFDATYAANLSWHADFKIALCTISYLLGGRGC